MSPAVIGAIATVSLAALAGMWKLSRTISACEVEIARLVGRVDSLTLQVGHLTSSLSRLMVGLGSGEHKRPSGNWEE